MKRGFIWIHDDGAHIGSVKTPDDIVTSGLDVAFIEAPTNVQWFCSLVERLYNTHNHKLCYN